MGAEIVFSRSARKLEQRGDPKGLKILALGVVGVLLVGWLDLWSGNELRIFPLYYAPIAWVAWRVSRELGVLLALMSSSLWICAMWLGNPPWSIFMYISNGVMQGFSFVLIALLVGHLAHHIEIERKLSRQDSLTDLHNARSFHEMAELLLAGARRSSRPLTLAYLDLDNFKQVNDHHGHMEGDRALIEVARVLRQELRESDVAARLGGDEFAVLLPDTGESAAEVALERLRRHIVAAMRARNWPITTSMGAVAFHSAPASVAEAVHRADELMYRVKAIGKDRLMVESVFDTPTRPGSNGERVEAD